MGYHGVIVPVKLLTKAGRLKASGYRPMHRLIAVLVIGVLVAPALTECAGWAASAAGRHVCCANRDGMASDTSVTAC